MDQKSPRVGSWYSEVTRYQWLVLTIACLGWVFDVFEGQIFVASMKEAMPSLLPADATEGTASFYNNMALGMFLLGGALGGVFFGILSDRIGRTKTMVLTILVYSFFTCVTAFAQTPWQMCILRFLVAMGVGGEWAVASAMVAEVFPKRARAHSLGIFHASSVFGTYLAVAAGVYIVANPNFGWRWGFAIGALPALLTVWIRWQLHEPEKWVEAKAASRQQPESRMGSIFDLFRGKLLRNSLVGVALATVGMLTFWGVHIYGKDMLRSAIERDLLQPGTELEMASDSVKIRIKNAEMTGMFLVTTGGGLGLLAFGPICEWMGRRKAFFLFHAGGLASSVALFQLLPEANASVYYFVLPIFGFLTLGMHAGYAIYFPELFPTRLRGTGAGFCFNSGRLLAAPVLVLSGLMQKDWNYSLNKTVAILSLWFLLGMVALLFAPETKGRELPE